MYKVLGADRKPWHGGTGQWPEPGEWFEVTGALEPCENGLHLCRRGDLVRWLGPEIWTVEHDSAEVIECEDKVVVRRARLVSRIEAWNERSARLFASDCAEHVLPIYEKAHPGDARPRAAIETARRFARGEATDKELAAAWAAAWDAARDAARDAALAAAADAAWDAARAAVWAAAWNAARAAARVAAWDAARAAAWDAVWDAAGDAERDWQTERLFEYLGRV